MSIEKVGTNANSSVKPVSIPHSTPIVVNSASIKGSEQEKDEGMSTGAIILTGLAILGAIGLAGVAIYKGKGDKAANKAASAAQGAQEKLTSEASGAANKAAEAAGGATTKPITDASHLLPPHQPTLEDFNKCRQNAEQQARHYVKLTKQQETKPITDASHLLPQKCPLSPEEQRFEKSLDKALYNYTEGNILQDMSAEQQGILKKLYAQDLPSLPNERWASLEGLYRDPKTQDVVLYNKNGYELIRLSEKNGALSLHKSYPDGSFINIENGKLKWAVLDSRIPQGDKIIKSLEQKANSLKNGKCIEFPSNSQEINGVICDASGNKLNGVYIDIDERSGRTYLDCMKDGIQSESYEFCRDKLIRANDGCCSISREDPNKPFGTVLINPK